MKKIISFFAVLLVCLTLCSCGYYNRFTKFYTKNVLELVGLDNLPKPNYEFVGKSSFSRDLYGVISAEEFHSYSSKVYEFLKNKYKYVETYDSTERYFVSGTKDGFEVVEINDDINNCIYYEYNNEQEVISTSYNFVYFNEEDLLKDYTPNCIILTYYHTMKHMDRSDFQKGGDYNFIIDLPKGTVMYDVFLFDLTLDYFSSRYISNKFLEIPKYPFYLVDDEIKDYDMIVESSSKLEEISINIENIKFEEEYELEKFEVVLESDLYYGVKITIKKNDGLKIIKAISFKKDKFEYSSHQMITDNNNEIRKIMSMLVYFEAKGEDTKIIGTSYYDNPKVITFTVEKIMVDYESEKNLKYIEVKYDIYLDTNEVIKRSEHIKIEEYYDFEG